MPSGKSFPLAVVFWTSFPDGVHADPCANLLRPPVGPSAADLAAAVATAPGTELVRGPSDVAVGGHPAKQVVLTVREDVGCDPGFFYTGHDEMWGPFWAGTNVGDTIRVWLVDVDGTRLFIEAETTEQADSDLEQEIQQIVESIRFENRLTKAEYVAQAGAMCLDPNERIRVLAGGTSPSTLTGLAVLGDDAIAIWEEGLRDLRALVAAVGGRPGSAQ